MAIYDQKNFSRPSL